MCCYYDFSITYPHECQNVRAFLVGGKLINVVLLAGLHAWRREGLSSVWMGDTTLSLCWSAMWEGLDLFNLCPSKAQKQDGWPCQEIGVLIGNPMRIWMVNLCPSGSPPLMERPEFSKILFQQVGHSAKLSLAQFSSKLTNKPTAEACFFILLEQPAKPFFWFWLFGGPNPINSKPLIKA